MSAEVLSFDGVPGPTSKRPIELAREPPFEIGNLNVAPALREVSTADGKRQILEPRVMQVLVALTRARGAIVSRDDLVRTCWHGTIVGDDAINRPISLLRRISEDVGQGTIRIETIPRVGYRLIDVSLSSDRPRPAPAQRDSQKALWAGLAMLIVIAGGLMAWQASPRGPAYSISVQPFRTPAAAVNFNDQLSSALTSLDVPTVGGRSALTLTGSVEQIGAAIEVNARLMMPGSHAVLWSGAIRQPSTDPRELASAAGIVGLVAQCALAGANDAGNLSPELLSLYVRTCELGARGQNALGVKVARELTEQAPDFAAGWFALSHHALTLYRTTPRVNASLREQAVAAAERLIALRPHAQDGYVSKALALDPGQRVERERLLRRAIGLEPIYVDRAQASLSDLLIEVGRQEEAFQLDRVLAQQNPDQAGAQARLFLIATSTGRTPLADLALERVKSLDAAHLPTLLWRKAVWRGDWANAERYAPSQDALLNHAEIAAYRALASADAKRKDAAARQVMELPENCCTPMQAELLTLLGRRPQAIAQLEKLATVSPSSMPPLNMAPLLADPAMRPLWYDPTIEPFFRRIGLIDYWRSSGTRPDVCRKPGAPAFCRLLAN